MRAENLLYTETERIKFLMSEQIFLGGPAMAISSPKNVIKTTNWISTWDKHDWLNFVEITSAILSSIPQPLSPITSPILLGVSTTAGLANARLYFKEGDPYTGGLMLAFSVIPGVSLLRTLKGSKVFMRLGYKESIRLINAAKTGTATAEEFKLAKELITDIAPYANELGKETVKHTIKESLKQLPKKSLQFIIKLCLVMFKLGVFLIKEGIIIAGTFYTYEKIYKALNYKNEKNLSLREKNELVKLHNTIMKNKEEVKNTGIEELNKSEPLIQKNPNLFISIDINNQNNSPFSKLKK
jgi:hypothetical protein